MVKRDPITVFSVAFTKRVVAVMAQKEGGIQENLTVGAYFYVWGNVGYHKAYLDLAVALVLISNALKNEPGFAQSVIYLWWPYFPLRLKALASEGHLPARRLGKERKKANCLHIAPK